jgi:hypothetical protein
MAFKKNVIVLFIFISIFINFQNTAYAVVSPDGNIGVEKDWPRPLYISGQDQESGIQFGCSGTLIARDVVLTAAHCLNVGTSQISILYTKKVGSQQKMLPGPIVKSYLVHPRYNASNLVNDIGLIFLHKPINDIPISKLSKQNAELLKADKSLYIMGWGEDQNGLAPEIFAYYAILEDYTSKASKYFKKNFNNETMIAAGKYRSDERLFTGGCSGDSGGPLLSFSAKSFYVVGVTSYGVEDCNENVPTVFTRVAYYSDWICSNLKKYSSISGTHSCINLLKSPKNNDGIDSDLNIDHSSSGSVKDQTSTDGSIYEIIKDKILSIPKNVNFNNGILVWLAFMFLFSLSKYFKLNKIDEFNKTHIFIDKENLKVGNILLLDESHKWLEITQISEKFLIGLDYKNNELQVKRNKKQFVVIDPFALSMIDLRIGMYFQLSYDSYNRWGQVKSISNENVVVLVDDQLIDVLIEGDCWALTYPSKG